MNVNTYDATPLHEEVISGKPKLRAFDDFLGRWVEVQPDKFYPAARDETLAEVREYASKYEGEFITFEQLAREEERLLDVTHLYYF